MTKEQIDQMEAGPEMDYRIADLVFGIDTKAVFYPKSHVGLEPGAIHYVRDQWIRPEVQSYSTDIAAALEVVEKMSAEKWSCLMDCDPDQGIYFKFYWTCYEEPEICGAGAARAKNVPLAICRAALKAVMK